MSSRALLPAALACAASLALSACDSSDRTPVDFRHRQDGQGTPVATFGRDAVTAEELQRRFAEMSPQARTRYQTVEQRTEYVEGLVRFELLAQEAVRRGLHQDPDVVETAKKVMVQKLVQRELDQKEVPITEADIQAFYAKHHDDYVKPERVRLAHLFLAAPDAAAKAKRRPEAEALLVQAKALPAQDPSAFGKLARERSEEPRTRALDGDLRFLSREELTAQYGAALAEAEGALGMPGNLSGVLETEQGLHILKLTARQPALNLTLDQVRSQIQSRLAYDRRQEGYEALIAQLKKSSGYALHTDVLAKVPVDLKAPTQEAQGPVPGFLPPPPTPPADAPR